MHDVESAAARDADQSELEHQEALHASGLMAAVTGSRSPVFENADCGSTSIPLRPRP
jgi:hypothetical protein